MSGAIGITMCALAALAAPASAAAGADDTGPGVPRISSSDFPDGEPVIPARTTGTITLRPASPDDDVVAYQYGLDQDRVLSRVAAGPDGSADVPVTLIEDPFTGSASERFYARAVGADGRLSDRSDARYLEALPNPAPPSHEPGDHTGDGRADVSVLLQRPDGSHTIWNVVARRDGFYRGVRVLDSGVSTGPAQTWYATRADVNSDGLTDLPVAVFSSGYLSLADYRSDGNRYGGYNRWRSAEPAANTTDLRLLSGNVTGDGIDDVLTQAPVAGGGWQLAVLPRTSAGQPVSWLSASGDWQRAHPVLGDVDGDGRADLIELREGGNCLLTVRVHRSTGTAFGTGATRWAGRQCLPGAEYVGGDFDGDGRADVAALRTDAAGTTSATVFTAASRFAPARWWQGTGPFESTPSQLTAGDFDQDGRTDLAVVQSTDETRLWTLRSTGTAFGTPVQQWAQATGGAVVPGTR